MKRREKSKFSNKTFKFLGTNKEIFTAMREIITIAPAIGFIIGSFLLYKYFGINHIAQQQIDTFTILTTSLNFLILIGTLSALLIMSSVYIYTVLKNLKEKKEIPNLLKVGLIRLFIFYGILFLITLVDEKYRIKFIFLLIVVLLIQIYLGLKYTYTEDKFLKNKTSYSGMMSFDIAFPLIPLLIFSMLFIAVDKDNYEGIFLIFFLSFILFSLPYIYMIFNKTRSNITFTIHLFSIAIFVLLMFASSFFTQRVIQILNVGVKSYPELILDKDECNRLAKYKNLGYSCDGNHTLKNMYGVWVVGDKPIFQRLKKRNDLSMIKADKNSTKIWLHRDKIYTVL
jgi:hypothetical protein